MKAPTKILKKRLHDLERHLHQESPMLYEIVRNFRRMDRIAIDLGLRKRDASYASQVPWWPLISIMGTFSAGKSTFINDYLGASLQRTGNQAVDDKFTVIMYTADSHGRELPGIALDSDPRFPFYNISRDLESMGEGEGARIDSYLQLKTVKSDKLRGKILIDSPGFDADSQRDATLCITDYMIGISDLVLVFFDARHPEPGAMRDTLKHLVEGTIKRPDANKFLYILNQIDTAAREDNPEDVIASWQRALSEVGLTAGRFYTIFSRNVSLNMPDPMMNQRFESKRDQDMKAIEQRIDQVEEVRSYRIISTLRNLTNEFSDHYLPVLDKSLAKVRNYTYLIDLVVLVVGVLGIGYVMSDGQLIDWLINICKIILSIPALIFSIPAGDWIRVGIAIVIIVGVHFCSRFAARYIVLPSVRRQSDEYKDNGDLVQAYFRQTRVWRPIWWSRKVVCGFLAKRALERVKHNCETYVGELNRDFTNPGGKA